MENGHETYTLYTRGTTVQALVLCMEGGGGTMRLKWRARAQSAMVASSPSHQLMMSHATYLWEFFATCSHRQLPWPQSLWWENNCVGKRIVSALAVGRHLCSQGFALRLRPKIGVVAANSPKGHLDTCIWCQSVHWRGNTVSLHESDCELTPEWGCRFVIAV